MVWLLTETLGEGDEVVASGLQLLDGVGDDVLRSRDNGLVVQGEDGAGMVADGGVISSLAHLGGDCKRVARAINHKNC